MATQKKGEYVGDDELKEQLKSQLQLFESWYADGAWKVLHNAHYDWWTFPIDEPSSFRGKYQISPEVCAIITVMC